MYACHAISHPAAPSTSRSCTAKHKLARVLAHSVCASDRSGLRRRSCRAPTALITSQSCRGRHPVELEPLNFSADGRGHQLCRQACSADAGGWLCPAHALCSDGGCRLSCMRPRRHAPAAAAAGGSDRRRWALHTEQSDQYHESCKGVANSRIPWQSHDQGNSTGRRMSER